MNLLRNIRIENRNSIKKHLDRIQRERYRLIQKVESKQLNLSMDSVTKERSNLTDGLNRLRYQYKATPLADAHTACCQFYRIVRHQSQDRSKIRSPRRHNKRIETSARTSDWIMVALESGPLFQLEHTQPNTIRIDRWSPTQKRTPSNQATIGPTVAEQSTTREERKN